MSRHIDSLITMINQIAHNASKQETPEDTAQAVGGGHKRHHYQTNTCQYPNRLPW